MTLAQDIVNILREGIIDMFIIAGLGSLVIMVVLVVLLRRL